MSDEIKDIQNPGSAQGAGSEASPRPWKWIPSTNPRNCEMAKIEDANGNLVCDFGDCEMYYPTEGKEPSEIDRDFLIRAVNAHDALVAALESALVALGRNYGNVREIPTEHGKYPQYNGFVHDVTRAAWEKVSAALASLQEGR